VFVFGRLIFGNLSDLGGGSCDPDDAAAGRSVELHKMIARVADCDGVAHSWRCWLAD
jgi:hypothetical protein